MISKQVIKHLMENFGFRQADMVEALKRQFGQEVTVQSLNERISTRRSASLTTANLGMMADILGYKVVVMPKSLPTPPAGFELEDGLIQVTIGTKSEGVSK